MSRLKSLPWYLFLLAIEETVWRLDYLTSPPGRKARMPVRPPRH